MNYKTKLFSIVFVFAIISCTAAKKADEKQKKKYIMDMVYNNPGLPPRVAEFKNPEYVKEIGYNGMTPHWYVQCAITYDSLEKGIISEGSEERKWIEENAAKLNIKYDDFLKIEANKNA